MTIKMVMQQKRNLKVEVWDNQVEITVQQTSKREWVAAGDYMDKHIKTKGGSWSSAVAAWRTAARYLGN